MNLAGNLTMLCSKMARTARRSKAFRRSVPRVSGHCAKTFSAIFEREVDFPMKT